VSRTRALLLAVLVVLVAFRGAVSAWTPLPGSSPAHSAAAHHGPAQPHGDAASCQLLCEAAQMQALPAAVLALALEASRAVGGRPVASAADHMTLPGLRPPIC